MYINEKCLYGQFALQVAKLRSQTQVANYAKHL